jgi:Flp pilus assembly protein TadG
MKLARIVHDQRGTSAIEFAMVAPLFFALLFGVIEGGLLLWTQLGLQHGAQVAARCASLNPSACGTASAIQNHAAQQAYGLAVSPSTFTFAAAACGSQVSASYAYAFFSGYFGTPSLTLNAQACYPK